MSNTNYTMEELLSMVQEKAQSYSLERVTSANDVYHALTGSAPNSKNILC